MAFTYDSSTRAEILHTRKFAVANAVLVSRGDLLVLVNGRVDLAVTTNATIVGISLTKADTLGVVLATAIVEVSMDPGAIFRTPQLALLDANLQPGDFLDINATSDGIAAAANNDLIVIDHDPENSIVFVQVVKGQMLFA